MNGREVVRYRGATAWDGSEARFYHKVGLYRDRWPDPMTIHLDDYRLSRAGALAVEEKANPGSE